MQMSAYCMENRYLFVCKLQLAIVEIKTEMYQIFLYELILLNVLNNLLSFIYKEQFVDFFICNCIR